jgi:hypothetical protein
MYSNIENVLHTDAALGELTLEEHELVGSNCEKGRPIKVAKNPKVKQHYKKQHVVTKIDKRPMCTRGQVEKEKLPPTFTTCNKTK